MTDQPDDDGIDVIITELSNVQIRQVALGLHPTALIEFRDGGIHVALAGFSDPRAEVLAAIGELLADMSDIPYRGEDE